MDSDSLHSPLENTELVRPPERGRGLGVMLNCVIENPDIWSSTMTCDNGLCLVVIKSGEGANRSMADYAMCSGGFGLELLPDKENPDVRFGPDIDPNPLGTLLEQHPWQDLNYWGKPEPVTVTLGLKNEPTRTVNMTVRPIDSKDQLFKDFMTLRSSQVRSMPSNPQSAANSTRSAQV